MQIISDFSSLEKLLLPPNCRFPSDAQDVINCWESKDILACPGSGKTTVLIAKLKLLADLLPLPDGRGVCVLSHTNVAINEIKNKFGKLAYRLLSYPNFVGTIQTFIDKYILFPFIRKETTGPIHLVNNKDYATYLYYILDEKYSNTLNFIEQKRRRSHRRFDTLIDYMEIIDIDENKNMILAPSKIIAKQGNAHAINFMHAKQILLKRGVIRYKDTYLYVREILRNHGALLREILSRRFAFVFIDEYQDCSEIQRKIFERIFLDTETVFQKIGDINQTIYFDINCKDSYWDYSQDYLSINCTNRASQEIADILCKIQPEQNRIIASRGYCNIKPILFVYDDISKVLPSFIQQIKSNNLIKQDGIYKAIGIYNNVSGLKISDYWPQFRSKNKINSENTYQHFITSIMTALNAGKVYIAERIIRKLICRILVLVDKKNDDGRYYTERTIKPFLVDFCKQEYKTYILNLINETPFTYENVKNNVNKIIFFILGNNIFNEVPRHFLIENQPDNTHDVDNIYKSEEYGINIYFDTVHGIKGETHDATLYLETVYNRSSDIIRAIKIATDKEKNDTETYKKDRNCVYVGLSRPKYLLCLAIRSKTYSSYREFFSEWNIIHLD